MKVFIGFHYCSVIQLVQFLVQLLLFSTSWCSSSVTYLLEICCLLWLL